MGYVFNSGPYSVDSCVDEKHLSRPDQCGPIPEIVPLLPKPELPPRDHRIFLSVCRSPWRFLNQKALACIRIAIAFYLTTILALGLFCELRNASFGKLYAFEVGNVSLMVQAVYYWISSVSGLRQFESVKCCQYISFDQLCAGMDPTTSYRAQLFPGRRAFGRRHLFQSRSLAWIPQIDGCRFEEAHRILCVLHGSRHLSFLGDYHVLAGAVPA